jgi:hypothetical protein
MFSMINFVSLTDTDKKNILEGSELFMQVKLGPLNPTDHSI